MCFAGRSDSLDRTRSMINRIREDRILQRRRARAALRRINLSERIRFGVLTTGITFRGMFADATAARGERIMLITAAP